MPADCGRRVRIERMTRERALVEHRAHVDAAAADVRVDACPRCARSRSAAGQVGERRRAFGGHAELVEQHPRAAGRVQRTGGGQLLAAHGGRAMKQARRAAGMAMSVAIFAPPPDWPNKVTQSGIAAERRDVVAHPAQREHQVEHSRVAGVGKAGQIRDNRTG